MNSPGIVTDDITVIASTLPLAPAVAKSDLRNRYNHDHNEESFFARMWSNKVNPIDKRIHQQSVQKIRSRRKTDREFLCCLNPDFNPVKNREVFREVPFPG